MNILMINGSPRLHGNTRTALNTIMDGISKNMPNASVACIDASKKQILPCVHCDACLHNGGNCILPDEGQEVMGQMSDADVIIFGSPVYWWGISGHLKLIIDKMYSKSTAFHKMNKTIGMVIAGHAELDDPQYRIIREQFECICDYLGWDFVFYEAMSTPELNSLKNSPEKLAQLSKLWEKLK